MERCFIVAEESGFLKEYIKYSKMSEVQREFICKFFDEKGIVANKYLVSGNGSMNVSFSERNKDNICLYIKPTTSDEEKFGKWLKVPSKVHGLCGFKKNSMIAKEFAQKCVEEQIVVNLWKPQIRDYFESLGLRGYSSRIFKHNEIYYLEVESDYLKNDDTPQGFIEIKRSEFYKALEEVEGKK